MKAILIAEKPSLMRDIQSAYQSCKNRIPFDIDFISQAGHLVGLKMPEEIDAEKYQRWNMSNFPIDVPYVYKILPGKGELLSKIRAALRSGEYDFVIHAGDPDGEGELLVRLVLNYVGNTLPVKRFWSNDLTREAIVQVLCNLKDDREYDSVYKAALVRQHTDYQFGMNITGTATLKMGELFKLGRVKAPIIKMIVDREREIANFVQSSTWKRAFVYDGCEFVNQEEFPTKERVLEEMPKSTRAVVAKVQSDVKNAKAPKLFKLSTLQTAAHKKLGYSGSQTLAILQKLYEAHLVSYPRTDCEYIASGVDIDGISKAVSGYIGVDPSLLVRSAGEIKKDSAYVNDAAIATEGHTAVIPTGQPPRNLDPYEMALYEFISRRFLSIFGAVKQVRNTSVTAYPDGKQEYGDYVWKESYDVDPGYEIIANPAYQVREKSGKSFVRGDELSPIEFHEKECVSRPPARYNDGSLIEALDKPEVFRDEEGKVGYKIGTPATRAAIIDDCVRCGYFVKDKKTIFTPTPKAERIVDELGDLALFQVTNSGRLESLLEQIRHGKADASGIEEELLNECHKAVEEIKSRSIEKKKYAAEVLGKCPNCGGDVLSGKYGAYCSKKCGMIVSKAIGKSLTDAQVKSLLSGKKTLVKGLKNKAGKIYDAYLTPEGVEAFTYSGKEGAIVEGVSYKFKMDFPHKKK